MRKENIDHNFSESDEEIINSYKNGDRGEFEKLVIRYTSPLYNFAARLGSKNDAADIVQEIFIKVWKNINNFNHEKASFKTWVFTIAKNTTTDFLRKKKSFLFTDLEKKEDEELNSFSENIADENLLPDEALEELEEKIADSELLNDLLSKLNPTYREVLILHYQEEMTFEEIGKVLDKPLNTVKSHHRRAIMKLKKMIE